MLDPILDALVTAALHAVDPCEAVRKHLTLVDDWLEIGGVRLNLATQFDRVILVAVGKASIPMSEAAYEVLGDRICQGVAITKYGHTPAETPLLSRTNATILESAHPVPDANSLKAGELVIESVSHGTTRTLILALISGGASALMIAPHPGIHLNTVQAINDAMLRSGADIREMNIVRSRLDRLKGGGVVRLAEPSLVCGLILSDVVGDPLDVIASGLTNDSHARNVLVANNTQACEAVATAAQKLGYQARIVTTELHGEARERGSEIALAITDEQLRGERHCLIYGGETTVTLKGNGTGGRSQELALAAAIQLDRTQKSTAQSCQCTITAFGTDGTDGPTDAAGAIARMDTLRRASILGMDAEDYLARNDSYPYFQALGDLVKTGPTGTNVADIVVALRDA